jgi:hypothetical protein
MALLVALAIAVFQDKMRAWFMRPKLDVSIDVTPPDCLKIPLCRYGPDGTQEVVADTYQLRLRVTNWGHQKAESVYVFASKLSRRQADDTFKEENSFLPMDLLWAGYRQPFFPAAISPKMCRHCDLAHVIEPHKRAGCTMENRTWPNVPAGKTILSFDIAVKHSTLSHLLPPGKYRLDLAVAAANAEPVWKTLEISLTGDWYDDEQRMFREGVGVRIL